VLGVRLGSLFGVAVAISLTQDYIPPRIEVFIKNIVELLAAIASVVYGLWGIFVVIPAIRPDDAHRTERFFLRNPYFGPIQPFSSAAMQA
jgi:phosphate transport system permease protein